MKIQIQSIHFDADQKLIDFIERKLEKLETFHDKESWKQLMLNGMGRNYSWDKPAKEYAAVYEEVERRKA